MRTLRLRLLGAAALLGILALLAGVPATLIAIGAIPGPRRTPTFHSIWGWLTQPDDGRLLLGVFTIAAWAAWLFLAVAVILEILARLRGVSTPRLPGLSLPQGIARRLVSATALLFTALPLTGTVANAAPPSPPAATAAVHPGHNAAPAASAPTNNHTARAPAKQHTRSHTVRPGETLWSIAEDYLGDGTRYHEIARLNYDHRQDDGGQLTETHWIRPGWQLTIPIEADTPVNEHDRHQRDYTVKTGDTLWEIADAQLGSGDRYIEIFKASRGIDQPGGHHLTDPDEISPGWQLHVPAARHLPDHDSKPSRPSAHEPKNTSKPTDDQPSHTPIPQPWPTEAPTETTRATAASTAPPASQQPTAPAQPQVTTSPTTAENDDTADWVVRTAAGVGAVLAVGVLGLVATRRRAQQRRRQPGRTLPMPGPAAAEVEQHLRSAADPLTVDVVDVALRSLADRCSHTGEPLPIVRAARLTADQFDLYLAEPAELPEPWSGTADTTVWSLQATNTGKLDPAAVADVPAPYPALVTIGHDLEGGHVFLDLEHLGALNVAGDAASTREVIAAVAIELATSRWADDLQVTIVGAYPELEEALQTGRIRYLPAVGHILDELGTRADQDRAALAETDTPDLQHARVTGAAPDAWTPEIVLLAGPITERQRRQLEELVEQLPRVAIAAVTAGVDVGDWTLDLTATSTDLAVLSPIGLQLQPQRIDDPTYRSILEMVALTEVDDESEPNQQRQPEPTLADVDQITAADNGLDPAEANADQPLTDEFDDQPTDDAEPTAYDPDQDRPEPEEEDHDEERTTGASAGTFPSETPTDPLILLLGPIDLLHAGGSVEPNKRNSLLELAAYLALNPGASHHAIDDAVWPNRKSEDNLNTRNTATSKLRSWVGKAPHGDDYLPRHQSGSGYGFAPTVKTDWQLWRELLPHGPIRSTSEHLDQALTLVRGRPFEGVHPRRYAWAEPVRQRMISEIVDASYELARRRLMEGRWRAAEEAVVIGLTIEPALERLWRLRILAAHESGNTAATAEAIERLLVVTDQLGGGLDPETEDLLTALQDPHCELNELMAGAL